MPRDKNHNPVLLAWNGSQAVPVKVNPVTGRLLVSPSDSGDGDVVGDTPVRDGNHVVSGAGVSSLDGATIIPLHINNSKLLCNSG